MTELWKERGIFLRKFIASPGQVGSITPSSRFLAKAMACAVQWSEVKAVAELGAGTGAITRHLARMAASGTRVFLFEKDRMMQESLMREYPEYDCYSDAMLLVNCIQRGGAGKLDCIVSGLPFFNFPENVRLALLDQICDALSPGGQLIVFQYSLQMRRELERRFLLERIRFVPLNLPPAFIYVCRKRISNAPDNL